jgi:hypothetical protein
MARSPDIGSASCTFIMGLGLLPTYRHRAVLRVLAHTPRITLAFDGLIGRHPRPRGFEEVKGMDHDGCATPNRP